MRSKQNTGRPMGFTLIEVLVVVAIIAMLIAILLPSLQRARAQARSAADLSNMHQIGLVMNGRALENKDVIPRGGNWKENVQPPNWVQVVARFMGDKSTYRFVNDMPIDKMEIFHCPERTVGLPHPFLDYSVNALDPQGKKAGDPDYWDEQKESKITEYATPSRIIYVACAEREGVPASTLENNLPSDTLKEYRENWRNGWAANSNNPTGTAGRETGIDGVDVWEGRHLPETPIENPSVGESGSRTRRVARAIHLKRFTNAAFWDGHAESLKMTGSKYGTDSTGEWNRYQYWLRLYGVQVDKIKKEHPSDWQTWLAEY